MYRLVAEKPDNAYGSGFVEDYYNSGSCFTEAYYQWWYWEHSYQAYVNIVSPTNRTTDDTDGMSDVPFGGGSADAYAFISTTGDPGIYNVWIYVSIVCTVGGQFVSSGGSTQVQTCTVPTGETTSWVGWDSDPTMGRWSGTLTPSTTSFQGRYVTEKDPGGGGPDTCWYSGSAYTAFTSVTGGTWSVGAGNVWGEDHVGYFSNVVTYWRNQGRAPCGTTFPQRMEIFCPSGPNQAYQINGLGASLSATNVTACRNGSCQTRSWP